MNLRCVHSGLATAPGFDMARKRSDYQRAAGKLISVIQKEWGEELGIQNAEFTERVMNAAHELLQAGSPEGAKKLLGPLTVRQFIGDIWIQAHPSVKPAISAIQELLSNSPKAQ